MKKLLQITVFAFLAIFLWGCPQEECPEGVDAVLYDYSGLDGCTWILELENGTRLEPVNLHEFDLNPEDSMEVSIAYVTAEETFSICMTGTMVELTCISSRP